MFWASRTHRFHPAIAGPAVTAVSRFGDCSFTVNNVEVFPIASFTLLFIAAEPGFYRHAGKARSTYWNRTGTILSLRYDRSA
jgi:amino acid permease